MNADGTGQTNITNDVDVNEDDNRSWSSNGKIVLNSRRDGGQTEIYSMNDDGTDPARLPTNSVSDYKPVWSPDSSKLAFTRGDGNSGEIYSMLADGSQQAQLTENSDPVQITNNSFQDSISDWGP